MSRLLDARVLFALLSALPVAAHAQRFAPFTEEEEATETDAEFDADAEPEAFEGDLEDEAEAAPTLLESEAEPEAEVEPEVEPADSELPPPEESEAAPQATEPLAREGALSIAVGPGFGTIRLSRPTANGRQDLAPSAFAALVIDLGMHFEGSETLSYDVHASYERSIAFGVAVDPLFGLDTEVDTRVQRAELVFAPRIRFGRAARALALRVPVGMVLRSFVPELHTYGLPNQMLIGPVLRTELVVPLGLLARLRLGPELMWLLYVDSSLREYGASSMGIAAGAQAEFEADVGEVLRVGLRYRLSYTTVAGGARGYDDTESFGFVTLGANFL